MAQMSFYEFSIKTLNSDFFSVLKLVLSCRKGKILSDKVEISIKF